MLPTPDSDEFPDALRARRLELGLSQDAVAKRAGISNVMPLRYEKKNSRYFAKPSHKTWVALNNALEYKIIESTIKSTVENIQINDVFLKNATVDQIAAELLSRGILPTLAYKSKQ